MSQLEESVDLNGVEDALVPLELFRDGVNLGVLELGEVDIGSGGDVGLHVVLEESDCFKGFLGVLDCSDE